METKKIRIISVTILFFSLSYANPLWAGPGESNPTDALQRGLAETSNSAPPSHDGSAKQEPKKIYPKKTELQFEGTAIEGEINNPGDFYFQHRPEDKMDSLIKRRKNFHREMLRDAVFSK